MKRLFLAAALALAGCVPASVPTAPAVVADRTVLDEKVALSIELGYRAARIAAETAVDAGLLKGARAAQVAALDRQAYAKLQFVRAAYRAGNATSYSAAATEALGIMRQLVAAIR